MRLSDARTKTVTVPNDPDGGYIIIKNLSMEEVAQIEGKYLIVTDKEVRMSNYSERDSDFVSACLDGWGKLFGPDNRELKFTPLNVDKSSAFVITVDEKRVRFFSWINQERVKFAEEVLEEEESARKNS